MIKKLDTNKIYSLEGISPDKEDKLLLQIRKYHKTEISDLFCDNRGIEYVGGEWIKTDKEPNAKMELLRQGNKALSPEHNPKPFKKGKDNPNFKYTDEFLEELLDELWQWITKMEDIYDSEGKVIGQRMSKNIYYTYFLLERGFHKRLLTKISGSRKWFKKRMEVLNEMQEAKIQMLATNGDIKENFSKFVLINKYKWSEKVVTETNLTVDNRKSLEDFLEFDE